MHIIQRPCNATFIGRRRSTLCTGSCRREEVPLRTSCPKPRSSAQTSQCMCPYMGAWVTLKRGTLELGMYDLEEKWQDCTVLLQFCTFPRVNDHWVWTLYCSRVTTHRSHVNATPLCKQPCSPKRTPHPMQTTMQRLVNATPWASHWRGKKGRAPPLAPKIKLRGGGGGVPPKRASPPLDPGKIGASPPPPLASGSFQAFLPTWHFFTFF